MADPDNAFSTLDDFLLSLADGITAAQDELTRAGTFGPPGRAHAYHLPRVEFELKMNLRVVEDASLSSRYRTLRMDRPSDKHLLFKPATADPGSSTLDIAAVVRGVFVAVPANNGLPATVIDTSVNAADARAPLVQVRARNAAGEALPNVEVHFNVDREESASLSTESGHTFTLAPGTGFERGVVMTDAAGVARTTLHIDAGQSPCLLALAIDVAGRNDTLVYEVAR